MRALRILVTGATGLLGGYLVAELERRGDHVLARGGPTRGQDGVDLTEGSVVEALVADARPDVVIHTAALAAIADCARDPAKAKRINVDGTANVARATRAAKARLVHVSTDLVFDGEAAPYGEDALPTPLSVYGRTKADAELEALRAPGAVVARTSLLFGPTKTGRRGFFDLQLDALRSGTPITLFDDEWRTPLSLRAAAEGLVELAHADVAGIFHLGGPERMSRHEMGLRLARMVGAAEDRIVRSSRASVGGEPRPRDVSLETSKLHRIFPAVARDPFEVECRRMLG